MKTTVAALSCFALVATVACADRHPARDPAGSTNTTSAPSDTYYGNAPSTTVYSSQSESAAQQPQPNKGSSSTSATPSSRTEEETSGGVVHRTEVTPESSPPPAPATGPQVNDNPGVADRTKDTTNTGINDRDRHGAATPGDQGNSKDEIKITAAIRKALVGSKSLSFTAKNAKVITVGTKVTLRGPVKSEAERNEIESVAKGTAGVTEVDNQLEVKAAAPK